MSFLMACVLIHLFPGVGPEEVYPQTPSAQTLSVGSTFKVHCHTGWLPSGKVFWYKRQQGEHLQFIYSMMEYTLPAGRLSGQINGESTVYSLVVNDLQRSDSGWYYCSAKAFSGMPFTFGNGSKLVITGSPLVFLLTPPPGEILRTNTIQLMCLAQNAASCSQSIRWDVSGRDVEGRADSGTIDRDGTHSVRSYIDVPVETWRNGAVCTCSIRINATEIFISDRVFVQGGALLQRVCISLLYVGFPVAMILLAMAMVIVGGNCRNRQSGNQSSDGNFAEVRTRAAGNESAYAALTFNVDPALRWEAKARVPLSGYDVQ